MCGYCIENNAFGRLADAMAGRAVQPITRRIEAIAYLQNAPDIGQALAAMTLPANVADCDVGALVIACRGLEVLVRQGFDSLAYQALLTCPTFMVAVSNVTGESRQNAYLAADPRFDLTVARWIVDRRTFTEAGYLDGMLRRWRLDDGVSLLRQYADFRLKGVGLHRNDLDAQFSQTGVYDPVQDLCTEDRQAVEDRFPAFWTALLWLEQQPEGAAHLWDMVCHDPIGVPDFEGLELWLQRRATLAAYDRPGLTPFLRDIASVRPELYQYVAVMRTISIGDRASLLDAVSRLEYGDHQGDNFSLRQWLEKGDLQVS